MKKIVCDLCGESDFVKVNGFFECQVCGAKYTIEEARSMFVEVEDSKTVRSQAPANESDYADATENAVSKPKPAPTIVRKVVVQPKASNNPTNVRKIVTDVKKTSATAGVKPTTQTNRVIQTGRPGVVVKKVVVKPQEQKTVETRKVEKRVLSPVTTGVGPEQMIENLFILSQNAFDSENYTDAENYANRIIELDATNADAWLMKGNCAGKSTDGKTIRFLESINCWNTCLLNSKEDYEDYQFSVRTNAVDIAVAYVLKNAIQFKSQPTEASFNQIKQAVDTMEPLMRKANQTFGVDINYYEDKLASNINAIVTSVSKAEIQAYGKKKETQTKEAYLHFVQVQDVCILVWDYIMDLAKKHGSVTAILRNIVKIQEAIIRNCGYEIKGSKTKVVVECSMADRNMRLEKIKKEKKKLEDKFVDIRKRDRVEQKLKNEKYWAEHPEEKAQLETERQKLDHEVFELENSKLKMQELIELKKLEEEAIRLQVLKDNPTYTNKERTAFMEQLNKVRKQVVTKKRELAARLNPIDEKIEKYKKRIFNIDLELNQNRE